jgi:hypothetical protein
MQEIFPSGQPQSHIFCMYCHKWYMLCDCTGLNHGEGMYFALPQVPDSMTFEQRLNRWTTLVAMHPLLNHFDAEQFLDDQGPEFTAKIQRTRPILTRFMGEYKESDKLARLAQKVSSVKQDCDTALNLFYRGDWGQIRVIEWHLLQNAVQNCSNPEDFAGQELLDMQAFMMVTNLSIFDDPMARPSRGNGLNFQMEAIL